MPYRTNADLPEPVRHHLPARAQTIYREAFNHAFQVHAKEPDGEGRSHRIAWGAVKRTYEKVGDAWVRRDRAFP